VVVPVFFLFIGKQGLSVTEHLSVVFPIFSFHFLVNLWFIASLFLSLPSLPFLGSRDFETLQYSSCQTRHVLYFFVSLQRFESSSKSLLYKVLILVHSLKLLFSSSSLLTLRVTLCNIYSSLPLHSSFRTS